MKVQINGKSYTILAFVNENVLLTKEEEKLYNAKTVIKSFVYVFDKERNVYKFLTSDIKKVD